MYVDKGAHMTCATSSMALLVFLPRPESQGQVRGPNLLVILTYPEIPRTVRHCKSLVPMGAPVYVSERCRVCILYTIYDFST